MKVLKGVLAAMAMAAAIASNVSAQSAYPLQNGQVVSLAAAKGGALYFKITVPQGLGALVVGSAGGTGDCDLYMSYAILPTLNSYIFRPYQTGNREVITIPNPQPGDWYVMAHARSAFSGMGLQMLMQPIEDTRVGTPIFTPGGGIYANYAAVTMASATTGTTIRFTIDGTAPTTNSPVYTGTVVIVTQTIVRAQAFKDGMTDSYPAGALFTISKGVVVTPPVTPATGGGGGVVQVAVSGGSGLGAFRWAGRKLSDPAGLPGGMRYGEGIEGGLRYCQWSSGGLIVHAVFSSSATAANGNSVRWYHFTTNGRPYPSLAGYGWTLSSSARAGAVTWYRYKH